MKRKKKDNWYEAYLRGIWGMEGEEDEESFGST